MSGSELCKKEKVSFLKQIVICVILLVLDLCVYGIASYFLEKRYVVVDDDFSWVYQIDDIAVDSKKMIISGWAFALNDDSQDGKYDIILYNAESDEAYFPKMQYQSRADVNDYFACEYDYTNSGFTASISLEKLNLDNKVYEILLRPNKSSKSFKTGVFYYDSDMVYANPREYVALDVDDTDLKNIVNDGVLRVYRPDYGMYVYQYEGELYWIADENYGFVEKDTYVQFQMRTTQPMQLPQVRIENNWLWGNEGFYFTKNELKGWDTGKYRVAKCALPTEYSITRIWTGNHIEDWIWRQDFRPWYEFE